uniref:CYRIA/CYRIB Rac1 binding domain-containing protein n=1 Tax=Anopheles merus TaxID=30066 RepID=A0A182VDV2_ANOME
MGKLLSLLARDESTCCTPKTYDVFLDFENAAPTDLEREVYEEVDHVLRQSEIVLDEIQCYKVSKQHNNLNSGAADGKGTAKNDTANTDVLKQTMGEGVGARYHPHQQIICSPLP